MIYITCENSAVVAVIDRSTHKLVDAIDSGSTNGHRLVISPDGQRLYTENEEDGTVSVIDLPGRKLLGKIETRARLPASRSPPTAAPWWRSMTRSRRCS
jgi:YVTN family beta-propeller protein